MTSQRHTAQTPRGARDLMPDEVIRREKIMDRVKQVCRRSGYQRIVTPTFEMADALRPGLVPSLYDMAFKFFDREGRLMMLRPDLTTPIARLAAGPLRGHRLPMRLFTMGNIFRQTGEGGGREQEISQVGIELVGMSRPRGDVEAISLGLSVLHALGISAARVDIGSVEFLESVIRKLKLSAAAAEAVRHALRAHNLVEYQTLVRRLKISGPQKKALEKLPYLRGPIQKTNSWGRVLSALGVTKPLSDFLALARAVARRSTASAVTVDLGLIRDFEYYTGVVFEFYQEGSGTLLGQGGRYDRLIGRFGYDVPATGFALDLQALLGGTKR